MQIPIAFKATKTTYRHIRKGFTYLILFFVIIWTGFPVFWAILTSLKSWGDAVRLPPLFWGFEVQWSNYVRIFNPQFAFGSYLVNGLIGATGATCIALILAIPHAYVISRFQHKKLILASLWAVLGARLAPPVTLAVPMYIIYMRLHLLNTKLGVVLILTFLYEPFMVWILKGFFDTIPTEIEECARIDGCTRLQSVRKIVLPLIAPAVGASIIVSWLMAWNEFIMVFLLTSTKKAATVPVGILNFTLDRNIPYNLMMAAGVVGMVPTVLLILFFVRYLIRGLAEGAMKQ
ncbi:MAG: carbohydrate ABC transporter permease [Nitrospinota bacterium]|nr:MAG: carbohydrate ABC transporter permease [Nitrospinota bacterium]